MRPHLGTIKTNDGSFVIADIPGLIKGASSGKGLGIQFLKHIERTKVLVFLVDANSENVNKEYLTLLNELKAYNPELINKPRILLVTKVDTISNNKIKKNLPKNIDIYQISSLSNINLNSAINAMSEYVTE